MYIGKPTNTTEARVLVVMVQYYRYMCPSQSHLLSPLIEAARGPKGRKILWNDDLESYFKELNCMVSSDVLLSYPDWKIPFKVQTYVSDKQLVAVISHNKKPISFLSIILSKPHRNYTTTEKELLAIVE